MSKLLTIIIPAYNEEKRIGRAVDEILQFLLSQAYSAEVIVVDDGSSDKTAQIVSGRMGEYEKKGHELRLLSNNPNRGKGYSVKRGVSESRGEIVLFTDADLAAPITEAPKLIDPIREGQADVVFGSRAINRKLIGVRQPLFRDFGGRIFNLLMRMITGLKYKDTQCGFKAFRREVAVPVFQLQRVERFGFDPEILFIALKHGCLLREVPVVWNHSEYSTVRFFQDSIGMFIDILRIRLNSIMRRYDNPSSSPPLEGNQSIERAPKQL